MPGSTAVIKLSYGPKPKPTQPLPFYRSVCRAPISPQMSLIPLKPEKTRHWKQRRKSCRGMRAGRLRALISHVCCCQSKCLCFWEVFPCLALSGSSWDFIYYHQIYHVMNTMGKNKHTVGRMPHVRTLQHKGMQCSRGWYIDLFWWLHIEWEQHTVGASNISRLVY